MEPPGQSLGGLAPPLPGPPLPETRFGPPGELRDRFRRGLASALQGKLIGAPLGNLYGVSQGVGDRPEELRHEDRRFEIGWGAHGLYGEGGQVPGMPRVRLWLRTSS